MQYTEPERTLVSRTKTYLNPKYEVLKETRSFTYNTAELLKSRLKHEADPEKFTPIFTETFNRGFTSTVNLYRLRALRDIPVHGVKAGDLGGWVSSPKLLPQDGESWVGGEAIVVDTFFVQDASLVSDKKTLKEPCLIIEHNALITGNSMVISHRYKYVKTTYGKYHICRPKIYRDAVIDGDNLIVLTQLTSECYISGSIRGKNTLVNPGHIYGSITGENFSEHELNVYGQATVEGNCHLGAFSKLDQYSKVSGNVVLGYNNKIKMNGTVKDTVVIGSGNTIGAHLYGSATVGDACSLGGTWVGGNAKLGNKVVTKGEVFIDENAIIGNDVSIDGKFKITDNAVVEDRVSLAGAATLDGDRVIHTPEDVIVTSLNGSRVENATTQVIPLKNQANNILESLSPKGRAAYLDIVSEDKDNRDIPDSIRLKHEKIAAQIASYESDIVKILKYPTFTDMTNDVTLDMMIALSDANDLLVSGDAQEYITAVRALERSFMRAEANARKIAGSALDLESSRRVSKAGTLFAMVVDDGASETEKKNAFKQGMKSLEGIVVIPDSAVDALRQKSGLLELEA